MKKPAAHASKQEREDALTTALTVKSPHGEFLAELPSGTRSDALAKLEIGSVIELTGICLIETGTIGEPITFRLLLPSTDVVRILKPAPFWQPQRLISALCLALFALGILAWRNSVLTAEIRERNVIASERRRLARELHDSLEQALTAIILRVEGARKTAKSQDFCEQIAAIRDLAEQSHVELRNAIWDLRQANAGELNLEASLQRAAKTVLEGTGVQCQVTRSGNPRPLPPLYAENVFRIGQEALTNIAKHSNARFAELSLAYETHRLTMRVRDDGIGFSRTPGRGNARYGLVGMQERSERIGAELKINSGKDGTVVALTIPIAEQNRAASLAFNGAFL